jgi:hypothetical protein
MATTSHHEVRFADAEPGRGSVKHHGPGGAFFRPAEDISLMRLSSSGMSRRGSSGELDVNVPLHREGSPARFARAGSSGSGLSSLGADPANNTCVAYRGPFGHLGEDPDYDAAAVTTNHGPRK